MKLNINAACLCDMGRVRKNNEDNFYFDGRCLEEQNSGLRNPVCFDGTLPSRLLFAVFDGMGGESFGECASFAAAREVQRMEREYADFFVPERRYLMNVAERTNAAVVAEARERLTEHMGSTLAALYFSGRWVYALNLGDSRAYRLRDECFQQITADHVEARPQSERRKAPLTQYLGIDPEYMRLEPYIAKGDVRRGDKYLICSDGLTDMLTNFEISALLLAENDPAVCAKKLVDAALEHGGRDNITVIVCVIE